MHDLECSICGKVFQRGRAYIRNTRHPVCSPECYYKRIENPDYNGNRQGQRVARKVVDDLLMTEGWRLMPEWVVHHIDGDTTNNDPGNLMVFESHSDHMRWHRGGFEESGVVPVWRGDKAKVRESLRNAINKQKTGFFNPMPKAKQLGKKKC
jgi:hypothetical protein